MSLLEQTQKKKKTCTDHTQQQSLIWHQWFYVCGRLLIVVCPESLCVCFPLLLQVADKGFNCATLRRNQSLPSSSSNRMSDLSVSSLNITNEYVCFFSHLHFSLTVCYCSFKHVTVCVLFLL